MIKDFITKTPTTPLSIYNQNDSTNPIFIGNLPILYAETINAYNAKTSFKPENGLILLPSYDIHMANFFLYLHTNMYFKLDLTPQQIVWIYKINDEYGLPKELMAQIHNMISTYGNYTDDSAFIDVYADEFTRITIKGAIFDILYEIINLCNTMVISMTPSIQELETTIKTIIPTDLDLLSIPLNAITHAKTRKFICDTLKTCKLNDDQDEYAFLNIIITLLTNLNAISTLTKTCIDNLLACIHWQHIPQNKLNTILEKLKLLPNFAINSRITKGIVARENLIKTQDPENKSFYYNETTKFPIRLNNDYCKKIIIDTTNTYYVYTTTINPTLIPFTIKQHNHHNIPHGINIQYNGNIPLCILITINYNDENGKTKIVKKWQYNENSNVVYFKNINNVDDDITITFNKVYYV